MKLFLILAILASFYSSAFCCDCFQTQAQKERKRAEQLGRVTMINHTQTTNFIVSAQHIGQQCWPEAHHYPFAWPKIRRTIDRSELNTKRWQLIPKANPLCIEILEPQVTSVTTSDAPLDYTWNIKPLARGTATIKAQYLRIDDNTVVDEQIITITITD